MVGEIATMLNCYTEVDSSYCLSEGRRGDYFTGSGQSAEHFFETGIKKQKTKQNTDAKKHKGPVYPPTQSPQDQNGAN